MQIVPQQKKRENINIKVHILWCMNKIGNVKYKDAHNLVHEKTEFKVMHMIFFPLGGKSYQLDLNSKMLNLELHIFLFISKFKFEVMH